MNNEASTFRIELEKKGFNWPVEHQRIGIYHVLSSKSHILTTPGRNAQDRKQGLSNTLLAILLPSRCREISPRHQDRTGTGMAVIAPPWNLEYAADRLPLVPGPWSKCAPNPQVLLLRHQRGENYMWSPDVTSALIVASFQLHHMVNALKENLVLCGKPTKKPSCLRFTKPENHWHIMQVWITIHATGFTCHILLHWFHCQIHLPYSLPTGCDEENVPLVPTAT